MDHRGSGERLTFQTGRRFSVCLNARVPRLTAYAMRSPLGSVDNCVGRPRSVFGEAARILLMAMDMLGV